MAHFPSIKQQITNKKHDYQQLNNLLFDTTFYRLKKEIVKK